MIEPLLGDRTSRKLRQTMDVVDECARDGLRTLLLAQRQVTEAEYLEWNGRWQEAS